MLAGGSRIARLGQRSDTGKPSASETPRGASGAVEVNIFANNSGDTYLWLSLDEIKKVHRLSSLGSSTMFYHQGYADEYLVICAYKQDLEEGGTRTSYYFCDEKTATIMTSNLVTVAVWATAMAEWEPAMEIGIMKTTHLLEYIRTGLK